MKKHLYITDKEWFESTSLKNPIAFPDHKIESLYPEFYNLSYDLKLLVTEKPTPKEINSPYYNDYREKFSSPDMSSLKVATEKSISKNIFLNGFSQEHLEYIIPYIRDTAEILYLFKCPKIKDISCLSELKKLKCLYVYWNNSLESLWDMKDNKDLKLISFLFVTKLKNVDGLLRSHVEYICFDSSDNSGNKRDLLFDSSPLEILPYLKHLTLKYRGCNINY